MKYTLILAGLIAAVPLIPSWATASCVGPDLRPLGVQSVAAGGKLTLEGFFFADGCHDTSSLPTLPAKNIRILLVQGAHTEQISTTNADKDLSINVTVTIPPDTPPGKASIVAEVPGYGKSNTLVIDINAKRQHTSETFRNKVKSELCRDESVTTAASGLKKAKNTTAGKHRIN